MKTAIGFFFFWSALYYGVFIEQYLLLDNFLVIDTRVTELLDLVLSNRVVQIDLIRMALVHLALITISYFFIYKTAKRISKKLKISIFVSIFCIVTLAWIVLVSVNTRFFPLSDYAIKFDTIIKPPAGIIASTLIFAVFLFAFSREIIFLLKSNKLPVFLILVIAPLSIYKFTMSQSISSNKSLIIIGVDSLSATTFNQYREHLPHLSYLFDHAITFDHAYTSLGRTFPAWMSLLTGKPAAAHGAVFNLRNLAHVEHRDLFTCQLRSQGYHTIFAIDERRFNNIDESFCFNQVIGPKAGALDFLVQAFNDTPMTNFFLQYRISQYLLPFSYINVASYVNYSADNFVDDLVAAIQPSNKLLLAVHFESSHFPFSTRHGKQMSFDPDNNFRNRHVIAVKVIDQQIEQLLKKLDNKGLLNDALVIILSDHGESFGNAITAFSLDGAQIQLTAGYGHGVSLLNEEENRIILGFVPFKNGHPQYPAPIAHQELISLLDIRSVIEHYAAVGEVALHLSNDCFPVETGLRFSAAADYENLDEAHLAAQTSSYYEIDPRGRLTLREETLDELVSSKDVGLRCKDRLTYYKRFDSQYHTYNVESLRHVQELPLNNADVEKIKIYQSRLLETVKNSW